MPPAEDIKGFFGKGIHLPYNTRDIQSLMNSACGYYCLAFLHYINSAQSRSKDFYTDIEDFLDMFEDLNKSTNWKANEYFLKHFFVSKDPKLRREIEVIADPKTILSEDAKPAQDHMRMDCEVKYV
jgi:hypothetical protein